MSRAMHACLPKLQTTQLKNPDMGRRCCLSQSRAEHHFWLYYAGGHKTWLEETLGRHDAATSSLDAKERAAL